MRIKEIRYNIKLRSKMMASYCVLILIWFTVFSVLIGIVSGEKVKNNAVAAVTSSINLTDQYLSAWLDESAKLSMLLFQNRELQRVMIENNLQTATDYRKFQNYRQLSELLSGVRESYNVSGVRFYFLKKDLLDNPGIGLEWIGRHLRERYYTGALEANGSPVWNGPCQTEQGAVLRLTRMIKDFDHITQPVGMVAVDISERRIAQLLGAIDYTESGGAYLVNSALTVLSAQDAALVGKPLPFALPAYSQEEDGIQTALADGDVIFCKTLAAGGWQLVYRAEKNILYAEYNRMIGMNALLLSVVFAFTVSLSLVFSRLVSTRLRELQSKIAEVEHGNFDTEILLRHNDEISPVEQNFNRMAGKINELFHSVYRAELEKKDAEMRMLQSQINPHFLYNTLDTISWAAYRNNDLEAMELINKLAKFFRHTMAGGEPVVRMREELAQVRAYVDIQQARYGERVRVEFEIDEEAESAVIVKLTLQPLVENAYVHGVIPRAGVQGVIVVRAKALPDRLRVEIEDNGQGFDVQAPPASTSSGIGLENIRQRLQLFFAGRCSLTIESSLGKGTLVSVEISKNRNEKEINS